MIKTIENDIPPNDKIVLDVSIIGIGNYVISVLYKYTNIIGKLNIAIITGKITSLLITNSTY